MNIDTIKVELIDWIAKLNDPQAINKLVTLKKKMSTYKKNSDSKIFGSGKDLVEYIADDFNDTPDTFKEYQN